jgi:hypothetical protein
MLTFRPDIESSLVKRRAAHVFAQRWRADEGRLVFRTPIDKLAEMIEQDKASISFPTLNYSQPQPGPTATVQVEPSRIKAFHIGTFPSHKCTTDQLRGVLHAYEVSMTGTKDELVAKLAQLAANTYKEKRAELDRFFTAHRYLRMASPPSDTAALPVLENLNYLRNLVLTMYAMKHLRGNAVLEPSHENATYSEEELAFALLTGKVALQGSFVRAA